MASVFNIVAAIIFFTVISKVSCQCDLNSIKISQSKTAKVVQGKQEWQVTISNTCICGQKDLKLSCNGFQTAETIDPSVLARSGDECLVNNGQPIFNTSPFSFTYAWDVSFPFKPISSQISCS